MTNVSEGGYKLVLGRPLPCGTAIEVELPDAVLLGEVRYCVQDGPDRFGIGLENLQILSNIGELGRLVNGIMGASAAGSRPEFVRVPSEQRQKR